MQRRLIVLGIDGATFDVIDSLVNNGALPAFEAMFKKAARGLLSSTRPPNTPPAWTSMTTGVNPAKHGVFDFQHLNSDYSASLVNSRSKRAPEIWEMMHGKRFIIANLPVSYPPREIDGIMISGMLTPGSHADFAKPSQYKDFVMGNIPDYEFDVNWLNYIGRPKKMLNKCCFLMKQREKLLRFLLEEEWDLLFFVLTETDRSQHIMWGSEELGHIYEYIDEILAMLLELDDINLLIVSDHGFCGVERRVYVNSLLKEAGFQTSFRQGRNVRASTKEILKSRVKTLATSKAGRRVLNMVPGKIIEKSIERAESEKSAMGVIADNIAVGETEAFMFGVGGIYLNMKDRFVGGVVKESDHDCKAQEIIDALSDFRDDGKRVFDGLWLAKDIHSGPYVKFGPDIILEPAQGYTISPQFSHRTIETLESERGDHHPLGIFVAWGPDVDKTEVKEAGVCDIAPTILHFMGGRVPPGLDGRVLSEIISPSSTLAKEAHFAKDDLLLETRKRIGNLKRRGGI